MNTVCFVFLKFGLNYFPYGFISPVTSSSLTHGTVSVAHIFLLQTSTIDGEKKKKKKAKL